MPENVYNQFPIHPKIPMHLWRKHLHNLQDLCSPGPETSDLQPTSNRIVHLGTILSDKIFHQEEGVPQGVILSTTLFNVKINNIVKQVDPGVECSHYVDDFVIMYKSPTIDAIQRKLQHTINRLEEWTLKNGFTISKNKTVAMHFCPDKKYGSCFEIGQWSYPVCKRS